MKTNKNKEYYSFQCFLGLKMPAKMDLVKVLLTPLLICVVSIAPWYFIAKVNIKLDFHIESYAVSVFVVFYIAILLINILRIRAADDREYENKIASIGKIFAISFVLIVSVQFLIAIVLLSALLMQ